MANVKLVSGVVGFLTALFVYGLSRTELYLSVNGNILVMVLLLFTFTTIGVLIGIAFEKLDEPSTKKSKKKREVKNEYEPVKRDMF